MPCTPESSSATVREPAGRLGGLVAQLGEQAFEILHGIQPTGFARRSPAPGPDYEEGHPRPASSERSGQGRRGRLVALVLGGARQPGPVQALLLVVAGQHAEADGHAGADADLGQAHGGGLADIFEVRRAAADHHAQCDDGVIVAVPAGPPRRAVQSCREPAAPSARRCRRPWLPAARRPAGRP